MHGLTADGVKLGCATPQASIFKPAVCLFPLFSMPSLLTTPTPDNLLPPPSQLQAAAAAQQAGSAALPPEAGAPTAEALTAARQHILRLHALKEEGNAALKDGKAAAAVEKYSAAIAEGCPPAFAALLYSNRAAAHQSLGQYTEAIGDCGRARALNADYVKAHSRLAGLMMEVRSGVPALLYVRTSFITPLLHVVV